MRIGEMMKRSLPLISAFYLSASGDYVSLARALDNVTARVQKIVVEHLGVSASKVARNPTLQADLGADSLDIVELSEAVKIEFDIKLQDEDICRWERVQDIVTSVKAQGAR